MKEILFSIIIPIYNAHDFLKASIESIVNQTYTNYELILVNDGSTDNSLDICNKYSITYNNVIIINQTNQGVSAARNSGLEIAKGKYILFIDSDDFLYDNNALESIYNDIILNPADSYQFKSFRKIDNTIFPITNIDTSETLLLNSYGKKKISRGEVWNYVFNKSIIDHENIRFATGLRVSEDQAFVYSYLSKCKNVRLLDLPIYVYNLDNNYSCTKNHNYKRDLYDHIIATSIIIKSNNSNNHFINERIAMMILYTIMMTSKLTQRETKKYNIFFHAHIKFNYGYLSNNKFVFVLLAFINLQLSRILYKAILDN